MTLVTDFSGKRCVYQDLASKELQLIVRAWIQLSSHRRLGFELA